MIFICSFIRQKFEIDLIKNYIKKRKSSAYLKKIQASQIFRSFCTFKRIKEFLSIEKIVFIIILSNENIYEKVQNFNFVKELAVFQ